LLSRHLFLSAKNALRKRTGLLSDVPPKRDWAIAVDVDSIVPMFFVEMKNRHDIRRPGRVLFYCAGVTRYEGPKGFHVTVCTDTGAEAQM
jgi:hypothetical protein